MKSKITIDFEPESGSPRILMVFQKSEDVRDKLVKSFIEKFGYESRWCKAYVSPYQNQEDPQFWSIVPVSSSELESLALSVNELIPQKIDALKVNGYLPENNLFTISENLDFRCGMISLKTSVGNPAEHFCHGDLVIDENYVIGRVHESSDNVTTYLDPVNVTAFNTKKHFQPGTKVAIIQREYSKTLGD